MSASRSAKDATRLGSDSSIVGIRMDEMKYQNGINEGTTTQVHGAYMPQIASSCHEEGNIKVEREVVLSHQPV